MNQKKYSKEQLLHSSRFKNQRDLLVAVLKEDQNYTFNETEQIINQYRKGKVR